MIDLYYKRIHNIFFYKHECLVIKNKKINYQVIIKNIFLNNF